VCYESFHITKHRCSACVYSVLDISDRVITGITVLDVMFYRVNRVAGCVVGCLTVLLRYVTMSNRVVTLRNDV